MIEILIKIIAWFAAKNQQRTLQLLYRLEFGVSLFLQKLSAIAKKDNYHNLSNFLWEQSRNEKKHGMMLSGLLPSSPRRLKCLVYLDNHQQLSNYDGLSKKYLCLKYYFKGKELVEMSWEERLLIIEILEKLTASFYKNLAKFTPEKPLREIAEIIAGDELQHVELVELFLGNFSPMPKQQIDIWYSRLNIATLLMIWDAFWYFLICKK